MFENPIVVFDSGIGSLSIIKELRKEIPTENILYFADKSHFPYGNKRYNELKQIIRNNIIYLERYNPKLIVIASNTPSIQFLEDLKTITKVPLVGVKPNLKEAVELTKKKHIGIMATSATISSTQLDLLINKEIPQNIFITKFNASSIIDIIENGLYQYSEDDIFNLITDILGDKIDSVIDVLILGSTHLAFIKSYIKELFPTIRTIDPAKIVTKKIKQLLKQQIGIKKYGNGKLQVIASSDKHEFQRLLRYMGIRENVQEVFLSY